MDRYLGLALLKDLVKNAQIMGVDKAVTDIDGHILCELHLIKNYYSIKKIEL